MALSIRRHVLHDIIALAICLAGILGLIVFFVLTKTRGDTAPRPLFLFLLVMVASPYLIALRRQPKVLYLVPAIVVVFLMYPIAAPHDVVYYRDPVFNYQFSLDVIQHQAWTPGIGSAYSVAYSYYPIGNVFISVVTLITKAPTFVVFMWVEPLARLIIIPAAVYAIGRRLFNPRVATLGLFLYLGSASILFNVPLQMGNGTMFFALAVMCFIIANKNRGIDKWRAYTLSSIFAGAIVMTHHLSSYIFAVWMLVMVILTFLPRLKGYSSRREVTTCFEIYLIIFAAYVIALTNTLVLKQTQDLESFIANFIEPQALKSTPVSLGRTFTVIETIWLAGALFAILFLAYVATRRFLKSNENKLAIALTLTAAFLIVTTLPLIATLLSYIPLRMSEYSNLMLAPMAATTVIYLMEHKIDLSKIRLPARFGILSRIRLPSTLKLPSQFDFIMKSKPVTRFFPERRRKTVLVAGMMALIFMGGSLAPISARHYFEPVENRITDSPFNIGLDSVRAAEYSHDHFGSSRVWSDQMGITVFGGLGDMTINWGHYRFFENPQMDNDTWFHLKAGDYIAVNKYMTLERPEFLDLTEPKTALNQSVVAKFNDYPEFALIYQDATFSIYRVMRIPVP